MTHRPLLDIVLPEPDYCRVGWMTHRPLLDIVLPEPDYCRVGWMTHRPLLDVVVLEPTLWFAWIASPITMMPVSIQRKTQTDICHNWQLWYHTAQKHHFYSLNSIHKSSQKFNLHNTISIGNSFVAREMADPPWCGLRLLNNATGCGWNMQTTKTSF